MGNKTVAIVHGWAEGAWQSRRFIKALQENGFKYTKNPHEADIVIGHSAGCYFVPRDIDAKLIVLIGLPYWPKKPLIISLAQKLAGEIKHHHKSNDLKWWWKKMAYNILYIFTRHTWRLTLLRKKELSLPRSTIGRKIILVHNLSDPFFHPQSGQALANRLRYKYYGLSGAHDDCWINPKPYIDLLLKEL
ncbi:MAG: hypothetical protein AAB541_03075 [Patescibacteria group bacterium]